MNRRGLRSAVASLCAARSSVTSLCVVVAVASAFIAAPALAWTRTVAFFDCGDGSQSYPLAHQWRTIPVHYRVDGASAGWITAEEALAAVDDAAIEWNIAGTEFRTVGDGLTTGAKLSNGKNEVLFLDEEWAQVFGEGNELLGITLTISDRATGKSADFEQCPSVDRCEVCPAAETDIVLNVSKLKDDDPDVVHTVIAHEFGHLLGLGHESEPGSDGLEPLMNATPTAPTLRADDVDAVESVYPVDTAFCEDDEDCVVGDYCSLYSTVYADISADGVSCPRTELCARGACQAQANGAAGTACLTYDDPECAGALECTGGERATRGYCGGERVDPPNPCEGNPLCDGDEDAGAGGGGGGSSGGCAVAREGSSPAPFALLALGWLWLVTRRSRGRSR
jgi:MYXO-CTERM domain-containing protein